MNRGDVADAARLSSCNHSSGAFPPNDKGSNQVGLYHIFKIGDLLFSPIAKAGNPSIVHDQFGNRTDLVV